MLQIPLLFVSALTHTVVMPIRPENRWLYPLDWQQLSATIRFDRAGARCERCARPHLRFVAHLGDGRWWDADTGYWRSDRGRRIAVRERFDMLSVRTTYVVLACAHLDHDPGHNLPGNLAALCQRCHMLHDAAEHRWQRWWNVFRLCALRACTKILTSRGSLAHHPSPAGGRGNCQSSRLPDTSPPCARLSAETYLSNRQKPGGTRQSLKCANRRRRHQWVLNRPLA